MGSWKRTQPSWPPSRKLAYRHSYTHVASLVVLSRPINMQLRASLQLLLLVWRARAAEFGTGHRVGWLQTHACQRQQFMPTHNSQGWGLVQDRQICTVLPIGFTCFVYVDKHMPQAASIPSAAGEPGTQKLHRASTHAEVGQNAVTL